MQRNKPESFLKFIHFTETCWEWFGACDSSGYGNFTLVNKSLSAHKHSFEFFKYKIPKEYTVDHLCRNRKCVNPGHLELCTKKENVLRGFGPTAINARKTHCIHGHPFNKTNTEIQHKIHRACKICHLRSSHLYYMRTKQKKTINSPHSF